MLVDSLVLNEIKNTVYIVVVVLMCVCACVHWCMCLCKHCVRVCVFESVVYRFRLSIHMYIILNFYIRKPVGLSMQGWPGC